MTNQPEIKACPLLPCPFCGVIPVIEETVDRDRPWFGVVCRSGKNVGGTCAIESRPTATRKAAVERWNTRADLTPKWQGINDVMARWSAYAFSQASEGIGNFTDLRNCLNEINMVLLPPPPAEKEIEG